LVKRLIRLNDLTIMATGNNDRVRTRSKREFESSC
jgi:hypothetical protein